MAPKNKAKGSKRPAKLANWSDDELVELCRAVDSPGPMPLGLALRCLQAAQPCPGLFSSSCKVRPGGGVRASDQARPEACSRSYAREVHGKGMPCAQSSGLPSTPPRRRRLATQTACAG